MSSCPCVNKFCYSISRLPVDYLGKHVLFSFSFGCLVRWYITEPGWTGHARFVTCSADLLVLHACRVYCVNRPVCTLNYRLLLVDKHNSSVTDRLCHPKVLKLLCYLYYYSARKPIPYNWCQLFVVFIATFADANSSELHCKRHSGCGTGGSE